MRYKITPREKKKIKNMFIITFIGIGVWLISKPLRDWLETAFKEAYYIPVGIVIIVSGFYFFKVK